MTDFVVYASGHLRGAWTVAMLRSSDLTASQKNVLTALREFSDYRTGINARPGLVLLAECSGVSRATVAEALKAGVRAGFIEQTRRGGGRSGGTRAASTYRLRMPAGVVDECQELLGRGADPEDVDEEMSPASLTHSGGNESGAPDSFGVNESGALDSTEINESGAADSLGKNESRFPINESGAPDPTSHKHLSKGLRKVTNSRADGAGFTLPSEQSETGRTPGADASEPGSSGVDLLGPPPASVCERHAGMVRPPACGRCATLRERSEVWQAAKRERDAVAAADRRARVRSCSDCDDFGWSVGADGRSVEPARRCSHSVAS